MGRGKIEIKRIENPTNRQVTFAKRKNGLLKKAKEIAVLCDAKVSVIIVGGSNNKMYNSAKPQEMSLILEEYHKNSGKIRLWDAKHEDLNNEIERVKKENDNMNIELKHLKGEDIHSLNHRDLISMEDLLENGLTCIREKKNEIVKRLRERRDIVEAENARLHYQLYQTEMDMQGNNNIGDGYNNQRINNGNAHLPFAFRVQPMQPNLQDRM